MPVSLNRLEETIRKAAPRLVVIDVLREIHKGKEDSADDMSPVMSRLRAIVRSTGTAIVLNHHMSKGGQARGSTSIAAGADSVLVLVSNEADGAALGGRLEAKGRSVRQTALNITFGENGRWVAADSGSTARTSPATARQKIRDYLGSTGIPQEAKEIAMALGLAEKTVRNELLHLARASSVIKRQSGKQGGALLYSIPAQSSSSPPFLPG